MFIKIKKYFKQDDKEIFFYLYLFCYLGIRKNNELKLLFFFHDILEIYYLH